MPVRGDRDWRACQHQQVPDPGHAVAFEKIGFHDVVQQQEREQREQQRLHLDVAAAFPERQRRRHDKAGESQQEAYRAEVTSSCR